MEVLGGNKEEEKEKEREEAEDGEEEKLKVLEEEEDEEKEEEEEAERRGSVSTVLGTVCSQEARDQARISLRIRLLTDRVSKRC